MSWLELDDRILEHPKFIRAVKLAGSGAIHLWLGLRAYCGQYLTDGTIPADMLDEVRGPRDESRKVAFKALFSVGLLEKAPDGGCQMHDFLDWSSSRDDIERRKARSRERKRAVRADRPRDTERTDCGQTAESVRTDDGINCLSVSSRARAPLLSSPLQKREERSPTPDSAGQRPRDPMADSFAPIRADVARVHAEYKRQFGMTGHVLRNANDVNAIAIAECIDSHGEQACMLVLRNAKHDGMVSGKADDKGAKHEKVSYIFGNPDTFARILRDANEREGKSSRRKSASELYAESIRL